MKVMWGLKFKKNKAKQIFNKWVSLEGNLLDPFPMVRGFETLKQHFNLGDLLGARELLCVIVISTNQIHLTWWKITPTSSIVCGLLGQINCPKTKLIVCQKYMAYLGH